LHRLKFVWDGACTKRLLIRNFSAPADGGYAFALQFRPDFADLFEVRGEPARARGDLSATRDSDCRQRCAIRGLDKIERIPPWIFDPAPQTLTTERAASRRC